MTENKIHNFGVKENSSIFPSMIWLKFQKVINLTKLLRKKSKPNNFIKFIIIKLK